MKPLLEEKERTKRASHSNINWGLVANVAGRASQPKAAVLSANKAHDVEKMMVVGLGVIKFRLHGVRTLKEKRRIVKSIIGQLRNNFNISVSEVGSNDIYQRAEIGFALVGNDQRVINAKIDKVFNLTDELGLAEIVDTDMEVIHI